MPLDRTAWASYFGQLTELPPVRPGLGLELLPYGASAFTVDESRDTALAHRWRAEFNAGLDFKLHPLPALTVTGTINPDFGQVDADPAFVNLTAYEMRLPEKRPFFVENNTLFALAPQVYFYSRRIGALPRVLPAADEIDLPSQVRILGAIAAGGYVAPQTQVALISAVTDEATATALVGGVKKPLVVSPLTYWGAGRMEQQVGPSVVAATATAVARDLGGTGLERVRATSTAARRRSPASRSRRRTTSSVPTHRTCMSTRPRITSPATPAASPAPSARACGCSSRRSRPASSPGSYDLTWFDAGSEPVPRSDYRVVSLRSTAVVRWEFSPGSILYLVWEQARVDEHLEQNGVHTFAIKLSYWFG